MQASALKNAVGLARQQQHLFVATADRDGLPHVAAAGELKLLPPDRVMVAAWFCPGTVRNLEVNRRVALVVWDPRADTGYQLLGTAEKVEAVSFLDGTPRPDELAHPVPQVERQVTVRVEAIYDFRHAPHTDEEL